jgi:hypothetical protein
MISSKYYGSFFNNASEAKLLCHYSRGTVWFLSAIVDWSNLPGNKDGRKLLTAKYWILLSTFIP